MGTRAPQDKRMPPKAAAVRHSPDSWKPDWIRLGTHGAGLCWDSSFGQQGQVTAMTMMEGAAGREMAEFKPQGEVCNCPGGIQR